MVNIFKIIFFVLLVYMLYNLIKLVFYLVRSMKNTGAHYRNMNAGRGDPQNRFNEKKQDEKTQVIELDKDQYRVE
jgi:hypothetical protein